MYYDARLHAAFNRPTASSARSKAVPFAIGVACAAPLSLMLWAVILAPFV